MPFPPHWPQLGTHLIVEATLVGIALACQDHHTTTCDSSSEENRPLEAQSAGLSAPQTWFQGSGAMSSTMQETVGNVSFETARFTNQSTQHNCAI